MSQHFCTCRDAHCKNHPANHAHGCDPCIQKNLQSGEIPACFFRAVHNDLTGLDWYTYESFAEFVRNHKGGTEPKNDG